MTAIEFTVHGAPQAKGSVRAFVPKGWNRPILTSTNRNLKAWENLIRVAANDARQGAPPFSGPVILDVHFEFDRPQRLLTRKAALLEQPHVAAPDLDKCVRAMDALTGILFLDDKQIVKIVATKTYAAPGQGPSCRIKVSEYVPGVLFKTMGEEAAS